MESDKRFAKAHTPVESTNITLRWTLGMVFEHICSQPVLLNLVHLAKHQLSRERRDSTPVPTDDLHLNGPFLLSDN